MHDFEDTISEMFKTNESKLKVMYFFVHVLISDTNKIACKVIALLWL